MQEDKQEIYEYEFLAQDLHVIMEVGPAPSCVLPEWVLVCAYTLVGGGGCDVQVIVRIGTVYVLAASAPPDRFEDAQERLRESAQSFLLG